MMGILVPALLAFSITCAAYKDRQPHAVAPGHITARQESGATITLGPRDNYLLSPTATANPTGTELRILPTDIAENVVPEGGLDFFFGPDLVSSLTSSLEEHCGDGASEECINSLVGDLSQGRSAEIEARVVGIDDALFIGIPVLIALVATLVENAWVEAQNAPAQVHMPSSDVVQLQSQTGSVIPIVTSSGGDVLTVPTTLPSTSVEGPTTASIFTLTADDESGHASGVTVAAVPSQTADLADQLLARSGYCPHNSARKRQGTNYDGVNGAGGFLIRNAAPGELINAFGLAVGSQLPRLRDEAAQASWDTLRALTDTLPDFSGVSDAFKDTITSANWQAAYQWCIEGLNDATENLYFEESLWGEGENNGDNGDGDSDDDNGDPACLADAPHGIDALRCDDEECNGNEGLCTIGDARKCACLPSTPSEGFRGTVDEWEAGQYILEALQAEGGSGCEEEQVTVEPDDFISLVDVFCSVVDLGSDVEKELTAADIDAEGYDGYTFSFKWRHKEGDCAASCGEIFGSFQSSDQCTSDSNLYAVGGHQDLTCGEASFAIVVDEDAEPEYNKALSIILEQNGDDYRWLFYENERGARGYCGNNQVVFKGPTFSDVDIESPPHPSGRYSFDIWGRACEFSGNGENAGILVCGDDDYRCYQTPSDAVTVDCADFNTQQHEGGFCEFDSDGDASGESLEPEEPEPEEPEPSGDSPIGDACDPNDAFWGCSLDSTHIITCSCVDGPCVWTDFGECQGGVATCHLSSNGNCGLAFGACC